MLDKITGFLLALIMAAIFIILLTVAYQLVGSAFDKSHENQDRIISNHKAGLKYGD